MTRFRESGAGLLVVLGLAAGSAWANEQGHDAHHAHEAHAATEKMELCTGFGPQTPRDIDDKRGTDSITFRMAPPASAMHLCNIHLHESAEHKAKDFSLYAGDGHEGNGSGYQCNISKTLSKPEMAWSGEGVCKSEHGDLKPGDTIEVHYVYTTCDVPGGKGLGSCVSGKCANPELRVESQVFTLVAEGGLDFNQMQSAETLPADTGKPVEFMGSTTGPKYDDSSCSEYQVSWAVRPQCAKVNIQTVGDWCKGNKYEEDHASA